MKSDRKLFIIFLLLAIICSIPFGLNALFTHVVPLPVGLLMLLLPWLVVFAIATKDQSDILKIQDRHETENLENAREVHFTAQWKASDKGSTWVIQNEGKHTWKNAVLMVESKTKDQIHREKRHITLLTPNDPMVIDSEIPFQVEARCRALLVSEEGYAHDLVTHWKPVYDWNNY